MNVLSGRYRVDEAVYGDGVTSVYRGYDQVLNRSVTIELLQPGREQSAEATALREKARQMALTGLPHVAALYDQGEHDGRPYLVFEELLGVPLSEAAPLAPADVVRLVSAVSATLRAAEKARVRPPHLDPESLRVIEGRIQIVDWGVAPRAPGARPGTESGSAALVPLVALAATGSQTGNAQRPVPPPIMRVVRQALAGHYPSVDLLESDLRRAISAAEAPTVAVPRAQPTVMIPNRPAQPRQRQPAPAAAPGRPRRFLLLIGAGLLALLGLFVASSVLRRPAAVDTSAPASASVAASAGTGTASPAGTATVPQGTPYVVTPRGSRTLVVRSGAGLNFSRVGSLPRGTVIRVVGEPVPADGFNWVPIVSDGLSGWCILEGLRPSR